MLILHQSCHLNNELVSITVLNIKSTGTDWPSIDRSETAPHFNWKEMNDNAGCGDFSTLLPHPPLPSNLQEVCQHSNAIFRQLISTFSAAHSWDEIQSNKKIHRSGHLSKCCILQSIEATLSSNGLEKFSFPQSFHLSFFCFFPISMDYIDAAWGNNYTSEMKWISSLDRYWWQRDGNI